MEASSQNKRDGDKPIHKYFRIPKDEVNPRNIVLLTLLGLVPVLWGMGLLPWVTQATFADHTQHPHRGAATTEDVEKLADLYIENNDWYRELEHRFTKLETRQETILQSLKNIDESLKHLHRRN